MYTRLLFCLLMIGCTQVSAQDLPIFDIGPRAGLIVSQFRNVEGNFYEDSRLGFSLGAWARVKITPSGFFIQPELLFNSTGGKDSELVFIFFDENNQLVNSNPIESRINFSMLEVPVLLGKRFGFKKLGLNVFAGPAVGLVLSSKTTFDSDILFGSTIVEIEDEDITDETRSLQFSILGGVALNYKRISLDARYQFGLSNVFDFPNNVEEFDETKLSALIFTLAYRLL